MSGAGSQQGTSALFHEDMKLFVCVCVSIAAYDITLLLIVVPRVYQKIIIIDDITVIVW